MSQLMNCGTSSVYATHRRGSPSTHSDTITVAGTHGRERATWLVMIFGPLAKVPFVNARLHARKLLMLVVGSPQSLCQAGDVAGPTP